MSGGTVWDRFSLDPRPAENAHLRASDDRDAVNDLLGTAYAEGRLTREELDERTDRAAAAKTLGELPPIIADLVSSPPRPRTRRAASTSRPSSATASSARTPCSGSSHRP